jgi:hypothetical protein
MDCRRLVGGESVLIDWSCSSPIPQVCVTSDLGCSSRSVTNAGCFDRLLDIKEVLLFPAMKPELGQTTPAPVVAVPGAAGQL